MRMPHTTSNKRVCQNRRSSEVRQFGSSVKCILCVVVVIVIITGCKSECGNVAKYDSCRLG